MPFRKDFTWGVATASYQIEGAAREDGRGESIWDRFSHTEGNVFDGHTGDVACDHYHRYEEDLDLMLAMGVHAYRFSIAWPRVMPDGFGAVNPKGLDFYDRLVDAMLRRGITPYATLFHWDLPIELEKRGAWENPDLPRYFADYTAAVVNRLGDRVKHFMALNEPQCAIGLGYVVGEHAPGRREPLASAIPMSHHMLLANGLACRAIRAAVPDAVVGYAPTCTPAIPYTDRAEDVEAARKAMFLVPTGDRTWHWNVSWWSDPVVLGCYPQQALDALEPYLPAGWQRDLETIHTPLDFYGQNIYNGRVIRAADNAQGFEQVKLPAGFRKTGAGWPVTPACHYWGPKFLYERYGLPIIITESGMGGTDGVSPDGHVHDPERIDYLRAYLQQLKRAAEDGVDIRAFFQWSLMDNFEWAKGYSDRFGLIYVDYQTQQRIIKDSGFWYKTVVESNGEQMP